MTREIWINSGCRLKKYLEQACASSRPRSGPTSTWRNGAKAKMTSDARLAGWSFASSATIWRHLSTTSLGNARCLLMYPCLSHKSEKELAIALNCLVEVRRHCDLLDATWWRTGSNSTKNGPLDFSWRPQEDKFRQHYNVLPSQLMYLGWHGL